MTHGDVGGARNLWYVDRGSGDPVLLVHGFPLDHRVWLHQIDALSERHRVIAPDLPGFGSSPPATIVDWSLADVADSLAQLLDRLEIDGRVTLAGLSMGGYIAWQFWLRHGARLSALMMCDTKANADSSDARDARLKMAAEIEPSGVETLARDMPTKLLAADAAPVAFRRLREMISATPAHTIAAAQRAMAYREDFASRTAEVKLPVLCLCGERDVVSPPEEMQRLAAALPAGEYAEIAGAGHLSPLESPAAVSRAMLDFLNRGTA